MTTFCIGWGSGCCARFSILTKLVVVLPIAYLIAATSSLVSYSQSAQAEDTRPVLLIIHGRDQPRNGRKAIEIEWKKSISKGLKSAKFHNIAPSERSFLWYGDALSGGGCKFDAWIEPFVGFDALEKLRSAILAVAAQMPNAAERALVGWQLEDTARYLSDAGISCAVDREVKDELKKYEGRPIIIIAHSMGSMILYKYLLESYDFGSPVFLITIGSMIAEPMVQRALRGSHVDGPAPVPFSVVFWRNIINSGDYLAFRSSDAFYSNTPGKRPVDVHIDTNSSDRHSAHEYLQSRELGNVVREAWCSATKTSCK